MTGGDCHDTLTPLSLPKLASSGHTGMLTGAVAWSRDGGPPRSGGEEEEGSKEEHKRVSKKKKKKAFWLKKKKKKFINI